MVYQEPLWVGECHWCGSGGTYHKSRLGIKVTFLGGLPVASTVGWSGSVLRCHTWPPELSEVCHYSSCYPASGALLWQQRRELKTQWPSIYTAWIHRGLSSNFVFLENLQINFFFYLTGRIVYAPKHCWVETSWWDWAVLLFPGKERRGEEKRCVLQRRSIGSSWTVVGRIPGMYKDGGGQIVHNCACSCWEGKQESHHCVTLVTGYVWTDCEIRVCPADVCVVIWK